MFNSPKTIRAILFSLGGIFCLALAAWMALLPNIIDHDVVNDSRDQQQSQLGVDNELNPAQDLDHENHDAQAVRYHAQRRREFTNRQNIPTKNGTNRMPIDVVSMR